MPLPASGDQCCSPGDAALGQHICPSLPLSPLSLILCVCAHIALALQDPSHRTMTSSELDHIHKDLIPS